MRGYSGRLRSAALRAFLAARLALRLELEKRERSDILLHCYGLSEIAWLIDVIAAIDGDIVSEELLQSIK